MGKKVTPGHLFQVGYPINLTREDSRSGQSSSPGVIFVRVEFPGDEQPQDREVDRVASGFALELVKPGESLGEANVTPVSPDGDRPKNARRHPERERVFVWSVERF